MDGNEIDPDGLEEERLGAIEPHTQIEVVATQKMRTKGVVWPPHAMTLCAQQNNECNPRSPNGWVMSGALWCGGEVREWRKKRCKR